MSDRYQSRFFRMVAVGCACLLLVPLGELAPALEAAQESTSRIKQLVQDLGVGAEVRVTPTFGEEIRGVIREIRGDQFALNLDRRQPTKQFAYAQVRKLILTDMKYKASGETDVVAVKRILTVVGPGHYVLVKTKDSRKVRGTIEAVGQDLFTLRLGSTRPALQIAYQQVAEVKPKPLSSGAKAAIIGGASAGAAILGGWLIYMMALCANEGC